MLTFNLKKQWFDKIKSGKKTHEYREVKEYWIVRLCNEMGMNENCRYAYNIVHKIDVENIKNTMFCFKLGYPKPTEKDKILYGKVKSIRVINGKNTDLAVDKDVYDIEFELVGDK